MRGDRLSASNCIHHSYLTLEITLQLNVFIQRKIALYLNILQDTAIASVSYQTGGTMDGKNLHISSKTNTTQREEVNITSLRVPH